MESTTIHDPSIGPIKSASGMTLRDFLHLHVLWPLRRNANQLCHKSHRYRVVHKEVWGKAEEALEQQPAFQLYIRSISQGVSIEVLAAGDPLILTSGFTQTRDDQQKIKIGRSYAIWKPGEPNASSPPISQRTRSQRATQAETAQTNEHPKTPIRQPYDASGSEITEGIARLQLGSPIQLETSTPESSETLSPASPQVEASSPSGDEQTVNFALYGFMSVLAKCWPQGPAASWSCEPRCFQLKRDNKDKIFEARVDGCLLSDTNDVLAIMEVKPYLRSSRESFIRMQEGAEMAAWMASLPDAVIQESRNTGKLLRYENTFYSFSLLIISHQGSL